MISTYREALAFLYDNLPMFQRLGAAAIKKDLVNTLKLCGILGDPHLKFRSIHVAGTNGKGSTCHMLASILQSAGYRTGLYTSPHLKEFTERIKINGREIDESFVLDFVNRIRPAIEEIQPSFFEITVAMAFDYFAAQKVDVAVIETGVGGRLDSTNVITPILSLITNISWDHKDILGDTLGEIAVEKAGIIKRGVPIVISERQADIDGIFIAKARQENAEIIFASDTINVHMTPAATDILISGKPVFAGLDFPLRGSYQSHNIGGVLCAVDILKRNFSIDDSQVRTGLEGVVKATGLKGRWQILQRNPLVVCDTGHNEGGMREVLQQIATQRFDRLIFVLGMVKDKEVKQILQLLPRDAVFYFCQAKIARALDARKLQEEAAALGIRGEVIPDVNEAKAKALSEADKGDLVFIGGSTYVVAELKEI